VALKSSWRTDCNADIAIWKHWAEVSKYLNFYILHFKL
jgi:hypothetical protein